MEDKQVVSAMDMLTKILEGQAVIHNRLDRIEKELTHVKKDVVNVKSDVQHIKENMVSKDEFLPVVKVVEALTKDMYKVKVHCDLS